MTLCSHHVRVYIRPWGLSMFRLYSVVRASILVPKTSFDPVRIASAGPRGFSEATGHSVYFVPRKELLPKCSCGGHGAAVRFTPIGRERMELGEDKQRTPEGGRTKYLSGSLDVFDLHHYRSTLYILLPSGVVLVRRLECAQLHIEDQWNQCV